MAKCPFCDASITSANLMHVVDRLPHLGRYRCAKCKGEFVENLQSSAGGVSQPTIHGASTTGGSAGHGGPKQPLINQELAIAKSYVGMMPPSAIVAGLVARCYATGRPDAEVYNCIDALKSAADLADSLECAAVEYEIRSLSNPPPNEVHGTTPIGAGSGSTPSPGVDSLKCPNCGSPASLVGQSFVSEGVDQSPLSSCEVCGYAFIPEPPETVAAGRRAERNANGRGNSNPSGGNMPRQPILNGRRDLAIAAKCLSHLPPKLLIGMVVSAAYDDPVRLAPTVFAMKKAREAAEMLDAGVLEYEVQQLVAAG